MTKQNWIEHIESTSGFKRPSAGGSTDVWKEVQKEHLARNCQDCLARRKTFRANKTAKEKREVMADLGLHRVTGALGGVYYE